MNVASYLTPLFGGALIGLSAAGLLYSHGRLAGISGIFAGAFRPQTERADWPWRFSFILGLVVSGAAIRLLRPDLFPLGGSENVMVLAAAGLLAGVGTRLGGGCTSGHGICGIGRLSLRSLIATGTFMLTGALMVFTLRHWLGSGA